MEKIIKNKYNITDEEVTEVVTRVKVLLINSNNELLLGYSHNEYQFPGGHVEVKENLVPALIREIEEETGIVLNLEKMYPFAKYISYLKDYPEKGKNRKIVIYYYEIKLDKKPNLKNTNYTDEEKEGHFRLEYISLDEVEEKLKNNAMKFGDPKGIAKEMLEALKIYKNIDNK